MGDAGMALWDPQGSSLHPYPKVICVHRIQAATGNYLATGDNLLSRMDSSHPPVTPPNLPKQGTTFTATSRVTTCSWCWIPQG